MKSDIFDRLSSEQSLPWVSAVLGALLAVLVIYQSHGHVNSDGLLYIEAARLFSVGEWKQGVSLYNWPLYPLLMAGVHFVSGMSLQMSAHLLAVVFFTLLSAGLLTLVRELGGNRQVMLCAAVLLFCSPYIVSDILPIVVRDHGFWAFHVWSQVFFVRFYTYLSWRAALGWGVMAVMATLFRIEAITYLIMLPLVLLMRPDVSWRQRFFSVAQSHTVLMVLAVALSFAMLLSPALSLKELGRLVDPLTVALKASHQLTQGLSFKAHIFSSRVLGDFLAGYALPGLLLTLAFALLSKAALSAGGLQLLFGIYSRQCRPKCAYPEHAPILAWWLVLGLINAVFIILSVFLLPKRYVLPIAFIIMIYGAFGLADMFCKWKSKRGWLLPVSVVLLAVQFYLIAKPQKEDFEIQAAQWVLSHAPANSRIYYDSAELRHYANVTDVPYHRDRADADDIEQLVLTGQIRQYDYMLVHVSQKLMWLEPFLTGQLGQPAAQFDNGRRNRVLIYRVVPE